MCAVWVLRHVLRLALHAGVRVLLRRRGLRRASLRHTTTWTTRIPARARRRRRRRIRRSIGRRCHRVRVRGHYIRVVAILAGGHAGIRHARWAG